MSATANRDAYFEDGRWLLNRYECPCGCSWTDEWACACDDDCPDCGTTCEASESEGITEEMAEEYGAPPLGFASDVPAEIKGPRRADQ
jgi:hypothetical protein